MNNHDTSKPIPVKCGNCNKDFSSSTILFHQKKHHPDQPILFTPSEISCSKCQQIVQISQLHTHYTLCEKRLPKKLLVTILEELSDGQRASCHFCKRKFAPDRIEKHQQACENLSRKRPIFDIFQKRLPHLSESYSKKPSKKNTLNLVYPNSKWQKQHLDLVRNLRHEESSNDDYIPCPHCGRKFGQNAADKHIEICNNIINKSRGLCMKKFPSVGRLKDLTIRTSNGSSLARSNSNSRGTDVVLSSFEHEGSANISPLKTPLLKKELLLKEKKEFPSVVCEKCGKRFLASVADKHSLVCGKEMKSMATLGKLEKTQLKIKTETKNIRSNSTQRLGEVQSGCLFCGASLPKKAKYCMMCGTMKQF